MTAEAHENSRHKGPELLARVSLCSSRTIARPSRGLCPNARMWASVTLSQDKPPLVASLAQAARRPAPMGRSR